jgi:histidyl-tRNA synthetase
MQTQPLPGFRDFYPADLAVRAHIFDRWRRVCVRYGFEEYDAPPLEPLELYTAKSGDEIVGQLYNFTDKGDRQVSLRPEMTPTVARMVAARAGGMKKPIRWFSIAQFFRYERQQRGRLREFFQLNCDLMGEPGPLADAEIIALAIDTIRGFGLGPAEVRVRLSDRRVLIALLEATGVTQEWRALQLAAIDRLEKSGAEKTSKWILEEKSAGLTQVQVDGTLAVGGIRGLQAVDDACANVPNAAGGLESLRAVIAALGAMGLAEFVDVDLGIVRGLAYYTGTVFELFDAGRTLRALAGGGRYDGLLKQLGGVDLPAVGFAIGDVVLGELLKERGLAPPPLPAIDVFVAGVTDEDQPYVLHVAHDLRDAGVRTEFSLRADPDGLGKQLKLADARQAAFAVVIGPDDRARGEVQLKDLRAKTQRAVAAASLAADLSAALAPPTSDRLASDG